MMMSQKIQVSERFQRSIRIDTDMGDEAVINSFICPQSSLEVLLSMSRGRQQANEAAFTWTGPFGSGKSSLVVALNALLGKDGRLRNKASRCIGERNADHILRAFGATGRKGWTFVPVVGSKGDVTNALVRALKQATRTKRQIDPDNLLEAIGDIAQHEECGLFIVIDEMGKFLESAAEGNSDIFLFQQLAELAVRSKGKIVILGVLHQAFAEYARRLAREIRDEWAKIQGRFVDLPLNVAGEELIDLIGRAIRSDKKPHKPSSVVRDTAKHISNWRRVHTDSLVKSLAQCWPLHPVVAALLGPISRRRFGQNQRSVFGFLNSAEPFGFQDFLRTTALADDNLFSPARLWDYLKANLEPSIMASPDGHKWSLAIDALFRAEAASKDKKTIDIVKCVALMDLFQERSGLAPEYDLLSICIPGLSQKDLQKLSDQSIICYRKHKKAYSLHQGSDFDIDAATEEAYAQIPALDFDRIRQAARFQPIVAKKHYHETGALRWFDVDLVPAEQAAKLAESYKPTDGSIGLVMIVLGSNDGTENGSVDKICRTASHSNQDHWPVFVSAAQNSWLIRSHAKELQAIEWIRNNNPTLGGDTVARREVETRLANIRDALEEHLANSLSAGKWFVDGQSSGTLSFKELHALASEKADELYSQSPKINSELVNRVKPSSNSMAALKALLNAMTARQGEERLGIVGYPAEGGLFETLLASTRLYTESKEKLIFREPSTRSDPCNMRPLWDSADQFFKKNPNKAVPITQLYAIWTARPFGVKDGLLPFFALTYLLTRQQDYAMYHEANYRPSIDDLFIDYLLKAPEDISLRAMNFSAVGQKILAGVAETLNRLHPDLPKLSETSEPLEIARRLVATVMDLPPWVIRTRQLAPNTIRLRELIKNANDPNKVLFDDLPNLYAEYAQNLSKGDVQPIIKELKHSLDELVNAYPQLMDGLRKQLFQELEVDGKEKFALEEVNLRAKNIMHVSGDFKLDAFAARLSTFKNAEGDIEGLASLAADKPVRDWIDLDVNRAKLRIAELSQQFNHAEAYGRVQNREEHRQAIAFMVGLNGKPRTYVHEFTVKQTQQKVVDEIEQHLSKYLLNGHNFSPELVLAALANIGAKILEKEESPAPKRMRA